MVLLEFFILLLQAEAGISGRSIYLYNKPGDEVVLPCNSKPSSSSCSSVNWLYHRNDNPIIKWEVINGNVDENSAGAARLSVNNDCSLIINNISAEEFGFYICRPGGKHELDAHVYLSILTLSPSPPDADLQKEEVRLTCSLFRYWHIEMSPCKQSSIRWLDDEGTELLDEVWHEVRGHADCVSNLTVKHQSDHNRRFTCQFVEGNSVKIEAHYTPDSADWSPLRCFMLTLRITGLILLIGITVDVIRRGRKKRLKESNVSELADEDAVKYENVGDHSAVSFRTSMKTPTNKEREK